MKIPVVLVVFVLLIFYLIIPILIWRFARNTKFGKYLTIVFLFAFLVILFLGITGRVCISNHYVIVDMDFTNNWLGKKINFYMSNINKVDFIINILMLIPIGFVLAYFVHKSFVRKLFISFVLGLICGKMLEITQFVLPVYRSVELSDVVLNTISVVIGCLLGILYDAIFSKVNSRKG